MEDLWHISIEEKVKAKDIENILSKVNAKIFQNLEK
jgi:hypothetical protein